MPDNTPELAKDTAALDEHDNQTNHNAIKTIPADERETADEPFRQAHNSANHSAITNAEHIEELRQELKPGALADPAERADAEVQLQLALNAAPEGDSANTKDPRKILNELKRAVRDNEPTIANLEYEYISAVHGDNPAPSLSESPVTHSRPAPANEIDALHGLKTAYENYEASQSAEQAAFAKLEAGFAQNKDLPEVESLIKNHISAQDRLDSHTTALFEADAAYKPFRQADQSSGAVPPEHQALKSLVSAYEEHDSARGQLAANKVLEAAPDDIEKAARRLDQAVAALSAAKTAYQPYEAAKSIASQPASDPPAANTTEIDGQPRPSPESAQTNTDPAAASSNRTQLQSATAAPGRRAHVAATAEPQNKTQTEIHAFDRDTTPQTPEPNSGAPNHAAQDRPPQTAHSPADTNPPPAARPPATTNNNSSPTRQSPAPQTAPRGREPAADRELDADTEADKPHTVTVEESRYQLRPVFGGPFRNLFRNVKEAANQQLPEPSPENAQPQKTAETKPQTTTNRTQTSLGSRLAGYTENRRQPERDSAALEEAHTAAGRAVAALNNFRANEGAAILNKINDAAATTKGGIREVLSEMRTNGAYEDLRKEFDTLYNQNASFRNSYDRATSTLTEYGDKRGAVAPIIQNQPQTPIAGKIKAFDEEIAKAAADIPGATEGQSITDKLAEKAREIVDAILEKLRKTFDRTHDPSPSPSPSPSL